MAPLWAGLLLARPERDVGLGPSPAEPADGMWPLWIIAAAVALALLLGALAFAYVRLRRT